MKNIYAIYLISIICISFSACREDALLIDEHATKETGTLYKNLLELTPDHILFGHQDDLAYGIGWAYEPGKSDGIIPINFNLNSQHEVDKGQFLCVAGDATGCWGEMEEIDDALPINWRIDRD